MSSATWTRSAAVLALLLVSCSPTTIASPTAPAPHTISVTGVGEVAGTPDTLVVDLGVSVLRPTVGEATAEASRLATDVIAALEEGGVERTEIRTVGYSVWPEYDYRADTPTVVGYRVLDTLAATLHDLDAAGAVIDAAVAAGGDEAVVNGIRFDIEEDSALVVSAREQAWADARRRAEQLASLAGVNLGEVVSVTETLSSWSEVPMGAEGDSAGLPVLPGQQPVSVVIDVAFAIG